MLGATTKGRTVEDALVATREAATLAVLGLVDDDEEVPTERDGAFTASLDVSIPAAGAVA